MFEYGEKVRFIVKGTIGTVIGFMRSRITKERDEYLVKFDNGDPEMWLRGDNLEKVVEDDTAGSD